jgi:hypothetical protein
VRGQACRQTTRKFTAKARNGGIKPLLQKLSRRGPSLRSKRSAEDDTCGVADSNDCVVDSGIALGNSGAFYRGDVLVTRTVVMAVQT